MPIPELPSPDQLAEELKSDPAALARALHVDPNLFLPDDEAPDVNAEQIRRLVAGKLPDDDAEHVMATVRCYRPWYQVLVGELLRPRMV